MNDLQVEKLTTPFDEFFSISSSGKKAFELRKKIGVKREGKQKCSWRKEGGKGG